jgi:hypothetical protein
VARTLLSAGFDLAPRAQRRLSRPERPGTIKTVAALSNLSHPEQSRAESRRSEGPCALPRPPARQGILSTIEHYRDYNPSHKSRGPEVSDPTLPACVGSFTLTNRGVWRILAVRVCEASFLTRSLPFPCKIGRQTHSAEGKMKSRKPICIAALILFAAVPNALARNTWYVDGVNGSDNNDCQSRLHACKTISNAISLTLPGDFIFVAPATYHESLFIPFNLKIIGSGAKTTIVDGGGVNSQVAVVGSEPKVPVTLSRMTFRNGAGQEDGGGIYNCFGTLTVVDSIITGNRITNGNGSFGYGAGIYNCPSSTLTLINVTISDNSALVGGAICNGGTLTIINSTFSGNIARQRRGGAIGNYGTLTITNSTFSGNSSSSSGFAGGILNGGLFQSAGTLAIYNSTLSGNIAQEGRGSGIFNVKGSTVLLQNSIVANNSGRNCAGIITSAGYNLSSDNSCSFNGAGDLNNTDPNLGPSQSNGGPTETMALLPGSPAIDSGNPSGCTDAFGHLLKTDQRGKPRPNTEDAGGCDRGAYERQKD